MQPSCSLVLSTIKYGLVQLWFDEILPLNLVWIFLISDPAVILHFPLQLAVYG
uniref:Uncharacterized protein n=1 Tax=Rhizophora mucronata TaxID=61149 RepID=A0A2P2M8B2_RHIMU